MDLQQEHDPLPRQPVLSTLYLASKYRTLRFISAVLLLFTEIREFTIGNGSFSVRLTTDPIEDSCYIEYVAYRNRWVVSVCPSRIQLRTVEDMELTPGCRELINTARCIFKTRVSTALQSGKPIEVCSVRNVMQALGFCPATCGNLYRVFVSRIGRPHFVVTLFANVNSQGENVVDDASTSGAVATTLEVLEHETVPAVVHRLRVRDKNYEVSLHGREIVNKGLKGNNSIVWL